MVIDGAFNHGRLIEFLQTLVRDGKRRRKKVLPILDNLGVHHCKLVKDERLNADLKHAIGFKVSVRTKTKLRAADDAHMQFIAVNRDRVRSYFQDPSVKYAA